MRRGNGWRLIMRSKEDLQKCELEAFKDLCKQKDPSPFQLGWQAALAYVLGEDIIRDAPWWERGRMNPIDKISFQIVHDDLFDRLVKEGRYKDCTEEEFLIMNKLKEIASHIWRSQDHQVFTLLSWSGGPSKFRNAERWNMVNAKEELIKHFEEIQKSEKTEPRFVTNLCDYVGHMTINGRVFEVKISLEADIDEMIVHPMDKRECCKAW
jgi:hypothetical protein